MDPEKKDPKSKDLWEKLDAVGKLVNVVFLAVIATIIKLGADNIAHSLKRGELVRSLISDLTTQEVKVRQDIALIALNRAIGDSQPELVVEIAEIILHGQKDLSDLSGHQAFKIIRERDPRRAAAIEREAEAALASFRRDLPSPAHLEETPMRVPLQAQRLAAIFPNVIYVQYRGSHIQGEARRFREELLAQGFTAPGVEEVKTDIRNNVRYFHKEGEVLATKVQ
jgi:hypothetical protein